MTTLCPKGVLSCTIVSKNKHIQYTVSASLQRLCTTLKREGKKGEDKDIDYCCINFGNVLALQ